MGKLIHSLEVKHLVIDIMPVNEIPVIADSEWIEQVIRNLLVNAIRHAVIKSSIKIEIVIFLHGFRLIIKGNLFQEISFDLSGTILFPWSAS